MNPVLLDTNALLRLIGGDPPLGRDAIRLSEKAQQQGCLYVAAISFWEVAMLSNREKIRLDRSPELWRNEVLKLGVREWVLDGAVFLRAAQVMSFHPDPADRFILASALSLDATLVTTDRALLEWRGKLKRQDAAR